MKVLILGLGYCGEGWYSDLKSNPEFKIEVRGQSRHSGLADYKVDLETLSEVELMTMLEKVDLWWLTTDVSKYSEELFSRLLSVLPKKPGIVLGSSGDFKESEYSQSKEVGEVDSTFEMNATLRNTRQSSLKKKGACVLHLAGIWGENRDPMIWLQKNLISKDRVGVNLIHRSDILKVLAYVSKNFEKFEGSIELLVDSKFYLWSEIVNKAIQLEAVPMNFDRPLKEVKRRNKIIKASRDWEALVGFKYQDYLGHLD
jgi:hypothetical protein